jgi:hypothetical protein
MPNNAKTLGIYVRIYLNQFRKIFVPFWTDIAKKNETKTKRLID